MKIITGMTLTIALLVLALPAAWVAGHLHGVESHRLEEFKICAANLSDSNRKIGDKLSATEWFKLKYRLLATQLPGDLMPIPQPDTQLTLHHEMDTRFVVGKEFQAFRVINECPPTKE
jgi:hypothetical protein